MSKKIEYIDTSAAAERLCLGRTAVAYSAKSGLIPGAMRLGPAGRGTWLIPLQPDGSILVTRRRKPGAGRPSKAKLEKIRLRA